MRSIPCCCILPFCCLHAPSPHPSTPYLVAAFCFLPFCFGLQLVATANPELASDAADVASALTASQASLLLKAGMAEELSLLLHETSDAMHSARVVAAAAAAASASAAAAAASAAHAAAMQRLAAAEGPGGGVSKAAGATAAAAATAAGGGGTAGGTAGGTGGNSRAQSGSGTRQGAASTAAAAAAAAGAPVGPAAGGLGGGAAVGNAVLQHGWQLQQRYREDATRVGAGWASGNVHSRGVVVVQ